MGMVEPSTTHLVMPLIGISFARITHGNHPRQSPTIRSSSSHFPVFGSPTATIEVAGNTGNPSSEKAGVGGSIPSLATIIANRLACFFIFASASNWSAPGGKLSLFLSNCGQPTLKRLQLSI